MTVIPWQKRTVPGAMLRIRTRRLPSLVEVDRRRQIVGGLGLVAGLSVRSGNRSRYHRQGRASLPLRTRRKLVRRSRSSLILDTGLAGLFSRSTVRGGCCSVYGVQRYVSSWFGVWFECCSKHVGQVLVARDLPSSNNAMLEVGVATDSIVSAL